MRHRGLSAFIFMFLTATTCLVEQKTLKTQLKPTYQRSPSNDLLQDALQTPELVQKSRNLVTVRHLNPQLQFDVSLLPIDKIQKIFSKMSALEYIPFKYIEGGCSARAHEIAMVLEKENILVGKFFVIGKLVVPTDLLSTGVVQWEEHVAPYVYTQIDQKIVPFVIDPSLFKKAVNAEEWLGRLLQNNPRSDYQIFTTSRFYFSPRSLMQGPSFQFEEWEIEKTQIDLENYTEELKKIKN